MPTVANMHHHGKRPPPNAIRIDRATPLGNPFRLDGRSRELVIELYEDWLIERLGLGVERVLRAYEAIRADSVLACWCSPKPCHGDVIVRAWEYEHRILRAAQETLF